MSRVYFYIKEDRVLCGTYKNAPMFCRWFYTKDEARIHLERKREKMRAKAASKHLNLVEKAILSFKMRSPESVNLNNKESDFVIDGWTQQIDANTKTTSSMIAVSSKTERHLNTVNQKLEEVMAIVQEAQQGFKQARSTATKERWAKRLVMAGETHKQLVASRNRLEKTAVQVRETIEDANMAKLMLETRINEAKIYRQLNGGLKLMGESLDMAKREHVVAKVEFTNFEQTMKSLNANINNRSSGTLVKEATKYMLLGNGKNKSKV